MKDANATAFEFLIDQLNPDLSLRVKKGIRYIKTNDSEKEWLKYLKINSIFQPLPDVKGVSISFKNENFLALINVNTTNSNLDTEVILEESINAGILTVLMSEELIELDSKTEHLEFFNEIMFQHLDSDYKGHDFDDLVRYLQPINFYSFPQNSVLNKQALKRSLCYLYSKNSERLINKFDSEILATYSELSLVGSNKISFELILSSLLSTSFKHTFLELYRLVERMFSIGYLKDFHEATKSELSFIEFSSNLEYITSWRPKEDEALNKIFDSTNESTKLYFESFFNSSEELKKQEQSKFFYKLRNSIVHFRTAHNSIELTVSQWNKLIYATLYLLDEHYSKNDRILEVK